MFVRAAALRTALPRAIPATSARAFAVPSVRLASTAAAAPPSSAPSSSPTASPAETRHLISNIEAQWKNLSTEEQYNVFKTLEELQKKDWKELSSEEKRAAYFVSFGPHGPRAPHVGPGTGVKTAFGVAACLATTAALFLTIRSFAQEKPKTMTSEWQEASNEMAREQKMDPISGIASEGYKGSGFNA